MLPKTHGAPGTMSASDATHRKGGAGVGSSSSSRLSVPTGNDGLYSPGGHHSSSPGSGGGASSSSFGLTSSMTPHQYFSRMCDLGQMDVQSTLDQMKTLLTLHPQRVYKTAYYRKQTKNHWARDDPAFAALQMLFLAVASLAYCVAFRTRGLFTATLSFAFQSIGVNWLLTGVAIASACRAVSNAHLAVHPSGAHVRQRVEWAYAFDIHCNAFFPLFVLVYGVQFFLLPVVLGRSLAALLLSNTLFGAAFGWYFYVTHLGYRALPFLSNTEVFLFPIAGVALLYVLNLIGYPFGFGWNASRIMAYIYFDE